MSWKLYRRLQRKGWLRCSSIRRSRIIFRTLSDFTTVAPCQLGFLYFASHRTFVLADILESVRAAIVLSLHDTHFAKGALAYDAEEAEMIKVYYSREAISTDNSQLSCIRTHLDRYRLPACLVGCPCTLVVAGQSSMLC